MVRSCVLLFALAVLLTAIPALSQNSLYIQHPQQTWRMGVGSIDTAVISMKPKGIFVECSMYLTFSGRGLSFTASDSVEVQYKFELPKDAQLHDLWLWVDNSIMQAQILDVWKASSIYEDIVKRRRDPAILFKKGERSYELRIYPMKGTGRRKIRLTYSIPLQWSRGAAATSLPMAMLRVSNYAIAYLGLVAYPDAQWGIPQLVELPASTFQMQYDSVFAAYAKATVMGPLPTSVTVSWPTPMRNGVFLKRYGTADAGTYQFALLPGEMLGQRRPRKLAVLIDYEAARTTLTGPSILATIKNQLKQELAERDSFTLMASDLNIQQVSSTWLKADTATIESAFQLVPALKGYSNLLALLAAGIDFIKRNGNSGAVVLISSSDQWGNYQTANQVIADLMATMSPLLPFHILDVANNGPTRYYFNSRYYYGNEYLYDNLARGTGGFYATLRSSTESFGTLAAKLLQSVGSLIAACDLITSTQGGFCYGRYTLSGFDGSAYLNTPIVQTGKYYGQFPFIIQLAGIIDGTTFNTALPVAYDPSLDGESSIARSWEGVKIASWEKATQTSQMVNSILEASLGSRVLSLYTAFLALEPNDTVKACLSCQDETRIGVDVQAGPRDEEQDSAFAAYPNPFNAGTVIRGKIPRAVGNGEVHLQVFNVLGQLVRELDLSNAHAGETFEIRWNAKNDRGMQVPSGTYYCVLSGPNVRAILKLLVLK